ncbi:hypothetical protein crov419 [Cafeteria roenbergensis virus]|uniref:Uncharacterized protein n=1 Tax=Cafeteria roenbergensis virus (strain BV-PW1) TaxID=693272 RepID=E3T5J0_CROVB|nr:hypothetical protein crov419 [Cafeteria roenbergensis virus BV-PW1]ADO67453.1 hypothetical protein crov419 [Cafeteria roenbergensis virus BV-PW1]
MSKKAPIILNVNNDTINKFYESRCTYTQNKALTNAEIESDLKTKIENINNFKYHNIRLLDVPIDSTNNNNNKNGIITMLRAHGGIELGKFNLPPNIKIITFYRIGKSVMVDNINEGFMKTIAQLFIEPAKINELKLKLLTLIKNFDISNKEDAADFFKNEFDIKIIEHFPCNEVTDQIISFNTDTSPNDDRDMGLLRLHPTIEDTDKYNFNGSDLDELRTNKEYIAKNDNKSDYYKHLILSYGNTSKFYRLRDLVYLLAHNLKAYQPDQILTIFLPICRPIPKILPSIKLARAASTPEENLDIRDKEIGIKNIIEGKEEIDKEYSLILNKESNNAFIKIIKKNILNYYAKKLAINVKVLSEYGSIYATAKQKEIYNNIKKKYDMIESIDKDLPYELYKLIIKLYYFIFIENISKFDETIDDLTPFKPAFKNIIIKTISQLLTGDKKKDYLHKEGINEDLVPLDAQGNKYYHKYLKYKLKYINLKKL